MTIYDNDVVAHVGTVNIDPAGGVLPHIRYIGMYRPKGYGV